MSDRRTTGSFGPSRSINARVLELLGLKEGAVAGTGR
jgi:hypothetical protein